MILVNAGNGPSAIWHNWREKLQHRVAHKLRSRRWLLTVDTGSESEPEYSSPSNLTITQNLAALLSLRRPYTYRTFGSMLYALVTKIMMNEVPMLAVWGRFTAKLAR